MSKTKSTIKKDFTPREFDPKRDALAREKLVQARVKMLIQHDFWGKIATRMRLINADAWCPTAATDGRDFYYNTDFILRLGSPDKIVFLFAHEVLHCVYDHIPRIGDRDRQISNIAQDYVINADLIHNNIGQRIDEVDIIYDRKYYGWSFEAVYEEIKDKYQQLSQQQLDELLEKLLDDHLDGSNDSDDNGNSNGDVEEGRRTGISKNRPKLNKEQKKQFKEEMREAMIQSAKSSNNPGNLPVGVKRLIEQITEPKLDWRSLINMKIPSLIKNDYTYQRYNKKYMQQGIVVPGMNQQESISVAIGIDASGSISQKQMEEQISEVLGIMEMFEEFTIRIWQFDTKVYNYAEFTKNNASDIMDYEVYGGGGTDFNANWIFMKQENIEPELFIMFTDGEPWNSWGDPHYCDTLFIINNKYDKTIKPPFGNYAYYE